MTNNYGGRGGYGGQQSYGDPWSGMENVSPEGEFGVKLSPGSHDVEITRVANHQSQRDGNLGYLVEFDVLRSTSYQDPAGESRSWRQNMKNLKIAQPAVKAFLFAVMGITYNREAQAWADQNGIASPLTLYSFSEGNPLVGLRVHVDTQVIKTQGTGFDFNKHAWTPYDYAMANLAVPDFNAVWAAARDFRGAGRGQQQQGYQGQQGQQQNYGGQQQGYQGQQGQQGYNGQGQGGYRR